MFWHLRVSVRPQKIVLNNYNDWESIRDFLLGSIEAQEKKIYRDIYQEKDYKNAIIESCLFIVIVSTVLESTW